MGWKDWLGLPLSLKDFAARLIQLAGKQGAPGWQYDPANEVLTHTDDARRFFLRNSWLEYSQAARSARPALLDKYLGMMAAAGTEVPKLWGLAAQNLYGCLRSRYRMVTLDIEGRGRTGSISKALSRSWHGDIDIVLMYDMGPSMMQVSAESAAPWGQTHDAIFARAKANLAALERPAWQDLGDGVFLLVSAVSYEESFVLVDAIWKGLPVQGDPVVAIPNRGVLLATGTGSTAGLSRLIAEAQRSMQEKPWPLSATLLRRAHENWHPFVPEGPVASAARTFELVSLGITYSEQKHALETHFEREGIDIYVGEFDFMNSAADSDRIQSWCSWTEGVVSLLPQTDIVILGRGDKNGLIVPWPDVKRICGSYLQATEEDPPRFRVDAFPVEEWPQLAAVGQKLG